jgi:hypothetical protein
VILRCFYIENGGFEVKIGVFEVFLYGKWGFKGKTGFFGRF